MTCSSVTGRYMLQMFGKYQFLLIKYIFTEKFSFNDTVRFICHISLRTTFLIMAAYIYQLIAYKILYLTVCFVLKRSLAICHITQGHFQQVSIDFGFHFQNCKYFLEYFGFYLLNTSLYEKAILGIFVYLVISKVTTTKVNFCFFKQYSQAAARLICERDILAENASIFFQPQCSSIH